MSVVGKKRQPQNAEVEEGNKLDRDANAGLVNARTFMEGVERSEHTGGRASYKMAEAPHPYNYSNSRLPINQTNQPAQILWYNTTSHRGYLPRPPRLSNPTHRIVL